MRQSLINRIPTEQRLGVDSFEDTCAATTGPFLASCRNSKLSDAIAGILSWYQSRGVALLKARTFYFSSSDKHLEDLAGTEYNAKGVGCDSRDDKYGNKVGLCGASVEDITETVGQVPCPPPPVPNMICTDIYGPGNIGCIKDVKWAFYEGKQQSWAKNSYAAIKDISGVSYKTASLEDYQRASFCGIVGKPCAAPPCECSQPPCNSCNASLGDIPSPGACLVIIDYTDPSLIGKDWSKLMLDRKWKDCYLGAFRTEESHGESYQLLLPFHQRMQMDFSETGEFDSPLLQMMSGDPDENKVLMVAGIEEWYSGRGIYFLQNEVSVMSAKAFVPLPATEQCLCVFDVDRTLTSRPDSQSETREGGKWDNSELCPGTQLAEDSVKRKRIYDEGYEGGNLTWSTAMLGLQKSHCQKCVIGIVSAGSAGKKGSTMRREILEFITPEQRLDVAHFNDGCPHPVTSPFVMSCKEGAKPVSTRDIQMWYRTQGVSVPDERVYFYDDRLNNIESFEEYPQWAFNARQISCDVRDPFHGGVIGGCGMTFSEISNESGIHFCAKADVPCSPLSDTVNDACRPKITWGFEEGKKEPKAHEWYMDFEKYTGISYVNGTLLDWQRAAYCGMSFQCGSPPCDCTYPPCHVCRVSAEHKAEVDAERARMAQQPTGYSVLEILGFVCLAGLTFAISFATGYGGYSALSSEAP